MRTIITKFIPASNIKGSRISAVDILTRKKVIVSYDHSMDSYNNHKQAFFTLAEKLGIKEHTFAVGHYARVIFSFNRPVLHPF
jgi:hypothetical protein